MIVFLALSDADPTSLDLALKLGIDCIVLPSDSLPDERVTALARRWKDMATPRPHMFLRLPSPQDEAFQPALKAAMALEPTGVLVEDVGSGRDVALVDARLAVEEAETGLEHGSTRIAAVVGSTAASLFAMGSLAGASRRLVALVHDPAALARSLAIEDPSELQRLARALTVAAARAGAIPAIDAAPGPAAGALSQGFAGKLVSSIEAIAPSA
jgi:citrate lyase beta subunit